MEAIGPVSEHDAQALDKIWELCLEADDRDENGPGNDCDAFGPRSDGIIMATGSVLRQTLLERLGPDFYYEIFPDEVGE